MSGLGEGSGAAELPDGVAVSGSDEPGLPIPGAGGSESASAGGGSGEMSSPLPRICGGAGAVCGTPAGAEEEAGPRATERVLLFAFARCSAISAADFMAWSPTLERSCSIRFFATSLSAEPGCWRITSL